MRLRKDICKRSAGRDGDGPGGIVGVSLWIGLCSMCVHRAQVPCTQEDVYNLNQTGLWCARFKIDLGRHPEYFERCPFQLEHLLSAKTR